MIADFTGRENERIGGRRGKIGGRVGRRVGRKGQPVEGREGEGRGERVRGGERG